MIYDVAIIGGGPAGYTAAEKAGEKGLKVVLFEQTALGGVCLNEGCIPTKTLLYSAKILDNTASSEKYGIKIDGQATADLAKIVARKTKIIRKLTAGIKQKLAAAEVSIVNGKATLEGENADKTISISCDGERYSSRKVLLCTGSEAIVPPIKGLDEYWTAREALNNKEVPQSLAIIGGGVIGIEFASFFNSLGVKVTVIEMLPEILGNMDKELSALLRSEYTKKGIEFYLSSKVVEIRGQQVVIEVEGEECIVDAEKILLSTGRRPVTEGLGLEAFNLERFGRGLNVNEYMQTTHPSIYACGDVTGFSLLAHTAVREGEVAINHIAGKEDAMSYKAIPGVVYTNPEFAGVGKTEEELTEKGIAYEVHKLPMAFSGRFVAENEMGNGICKILTNTSGTIIGCHMLGNPSSELIVIAGIAVEKEYTIEEFSKIVFPHPTVGEIIHEALGV